MANVYKQIECISLGLGGSLELCREVVYDVNFLLVRSNNFL